MRNEKLGMGNEKKCVDCLNRKVSKTSAINNRLCFCAKREPKKFEVEFYWLNKNVCRYFVDMSA